MARVTIRFRGERALFRNVGVPGSDVADADVSGRTRAAKGLIGNMLGHWRDFDDHENFGLASTLEKWFDTHSASVETIRYRASETRVIGQHRYKNPAGYMKEGESGPKPLTYHWDVCMDIELTLDDSGREELAQAVRVPVGTPYLGQSNCMAQVHLLEDGVNEA